MKRYLFVLTLVALSACSTPPKPPEPYGFRVPINQSSSESLNDRTPVVNNAPSANLTE